MALKLEFKKLAKKSLKKMNLKTRLRFFYAFNLIAETENTEHKELNIKPMQGRAENSFRLKIGNNRAIFKIRNEELVLIVIKVGSRGDIYK
jgi:mRNA interferase RelE/StbE